MHFEPCFQICRRTAEPDTPILLITKGGKFLQQITADGWTIPRAGSIPALLGQTLVVLGIWNDAVCCGFYDETLSIAIPERNELQLAECRPALVSAPEALQKLLLRGKTFLEWLARCRYCGSCGCELVDSEQEEARCCPRCGAMFFPKISPAVIVLISKGNRILLAHNRKFRNAVHSLIAGFVEPGESVEHAVIREVREETGLEVGNLRYQGSQSWPFPDSLMLGFTASYVSGNLQVDGEELTDADFYAPDALPELPGTGSIARNLISSWLARQKEVSEPKTEVQELHFQ